MQIVKNLSKYLVSTIDMLLELLDVELVELLIVEELEEALVELRDVVPPVLIQLHRHHDEVELPDGGEVVHDEGADGGGQHPTELGEEGILQDTANSRSRKPTTQTL